MRMRQLERLSTDIRAPSCSSPADLRVYCISKEIVGYMRCHRDLLLSQQWHGDRPLMARRHLLSIPTSFLLSSSVFICLDVLRLYCPQFISINTPMFCYDLHRIYFLACFSGVGLNPLAPLMGIASSWMQKESRQPGIDPSLDDGRIESLIVEWLCALRGARDLTLPRVRRFSLLGINVFPFLFVWWPMERHSTLVLAFSAVRRK